ncbi:MAG: transketolase [Anaerolineae bacterium]|jgi:transketolase|nr:transketolase [Anaerolineae bacterium]MBT7070164.1 transketolase [Anaerolineae bacterium]
MTINSYSETDQLCANTIRLLAADAVQEANSGHPGLPLGTADIATVLWTRFLKHNPANPRWQNRDRFILSAGHGSALLYALLHTSGYPLSLEEVKNFRQWGSHTAGHPEYDLNLGIELTTGPLGQGISTAVGMALGEEIVAARFNQPDLPIVDHYTYVLASDGDLMEGSSHETCALAGHLGLGKLIVLYDDNHISIDGDTNKSDSTNTLKRFEAYGWHTLTADGHDMPAIDDAIRAAQAETEKPTIIACRTIIGYGSPQQNTSGVHGSPLGEEGLAATKEHFGFPPDSRFYIPKEAKTRFAEVKAAGAEKEKKWDTLLTAYRAAKPDLAAEWDTFVSGNLPSGWETTLPDFTDQKAIATRKTSGMVLDEIVPRIPILLGGSADLTGSNLTKAKPATSVSPGDFSGNYIHYGIRELGMGAIMNGLALQGLRPFGGTFMVFSDYVRPAIRQAAMMNIPVTYVFTHDSIGLGEDGPTHQPIEQLTALRVMPNLVTLRPCDGNETAQAWKIALERQGPTALVLTRQGLPQITPVDNDTAKGAYVLADVSSPDVILLATGSEVPLILEAKKALAKEGIAARVVSMPSWELFDAQSEEYRQSVLLSGVPRLAVETGATFAWSRYVGDNGDVIGIDHFGASAPAEILFEKFGFSVENVVEKAKNLIS